jgi:hypothetical protein
MNVAVRTLSRRSSQNASYEVFVDGTSANRPSGKFSLMEFSEIRVRQDSYSPLYEP